MTSRIRSWSAQMRPVKGKVALISGGGSGHEPLHGGFVGKGMLDAACPGEVFTSPVPDQMLAATKAVDGGAGVIHIVKNYTGDVLNFKMAADEASEEGIKVEAIVIDDDVAVQDSLYTAGRRGVGATVIAEKIGGAAAERGDSLDAVVSVIKQVNARGRSFGIALSSCIPPASGNPIFDLPEGEMEVGIGIHGEPGRRRAPLGSAAEIADIMVEAVTSDLAAKSGANVLAFVNGMGGTPLSSSTCSTARLTSACAPSGSTRSATWSAATSRRSRWRERRSPCRARRQPHCTVGRSCAHGRTSLGRLMLSWRSL